MSSGAEIPVFKLLFLPIKLIRFGVKLAGVRNSLLLVVGIGIGLLIAPQTGAELRARLRARLDAAGAERDVLPEDLDLSL